MNLLQKIEAKLAELHPTHVMPDALRTVLNEIHVEYDDLVERVKALEAKAAAAMEPSVASTPHAAEVPAAEAPNPAETSAATPATSGQV